MHVLHFLLKNTKISHFCILSYEESVHICTKWFVNIWREGGLKVDKVMLKFLLLSKGGKK